MRLAIWMLGVLAMLSAACAPPAETESEKDDESSAEGYVSISGGKVWYRVVKGPQDAIPLLVLHGGPGAGSRTYESLARIASDRSVAFYDQLGAGRSDHPDDESLWTMERHIDELEKVRNELGLTQVHLLGHSWGAMLLMDYLMSHPSGIVSATFASPIISISKWVDDTRQRITELPADVQETITTHEQAGTYDSPEYQEAMMTFYHAYVARTDPWPESVNLTFEEFGWDVYGYMWGPSEFTITGTLKNWEREHRLAEIPVPTLFMVGEFDETLPATVKGFADQVEGSRYEIIADSAHFTFVDAPERSAEVVGRFLSSVDGS